MSKSVKLFYLGRSICLLLLPFISQKIGHMVLSLYDFFIQCHLLLVYEAFFKKMVIFLWLLSI